VTFFLTFFPLTQRQPMSISLRRPPVGGSRRWLKEGWFANLYTIMIFLLLFLSFFLLYSLPYLDSFSLSGDKKLYRNSVSATAFAPQVLGVWMWGVYRVSESL